jgi:SAM-dependent methyltransferase
MSTGLSKTSPAAAGSLQPLQKAWERMAGEDPLWAVLSDPEKRRGKWDKDEFFRTGEVEIAEVLDYAARLNPTMRRDIALDFGCGVGRLTSAMAGHFAQVIGLDISPTMIELARREDRSEGRCAYVLNASNDLAQFASDTFDFIYSDITLQHIRPPASLMYIAEFVRVLKPGGLLIFQVPSARRPGIKTVLRRFVPLALRRKLMGGMEMHGLKRETVGETIERAGGRLIEALPDEAAGRYWYGFRYAATKRSRISLVSQT